jgi:hypothetical protein
MFNKLTNWHLRQRGKTFGHLTITEIDGITASGNCKCTIFCHLCNRTKSGIYLNNVVAKTKSLKSCGCRLFRKCGLSKCALYSKFRRISENSCERFKTLNGLLSFLKSICPDLDEYSNHFTLTRKNAKLKWSEDNIIITIIDGNKISKYAQP